jgi:hypothetical protein
MKTGRVVAMNMGLEIATRRNFMLASSAQILLALQSNVAFGQSTTDLSQQEKEILDRLIDRFTFVRASNFTESFWKLWEVKVDLTLAIVKTDVREAFNEIIVKAQDVLLKDYGADNPIPRDSLHLVLAGTIFVQNIIFGVSTDFKSGIITITRDKVQRARDYYCSVYPYCR